MIFGKKCHNKNRATYTEPACISEHVKKDASTAKSTIETPQPQGLHG